MPIKDRKHLETGYGRFLTDETYTAGISQTAVWLHTNSLACIRKKLCIFSEFDFEAFANGLLRIAFTSQNNLYSMYRKREKYGLGFSLISIFNKNVSPAFRILPQIKYGKRE